MTRVLFTRDNFYISKKSSRLYLFFILLFLLRVSISAQIPNDILIGHKQAQYEFFFFKDLDSAKKFTVFSMARLAVDYNDKNLNNSFIASQFIYNFTKNWGISPGVIYAEKQFDPTISISYTYYNKKGDLILNLFPTVVINQKPSYQLFGLFFYTPKLNEKLNLFCQLIFSSGVNENFSEHVASTQQLLLGLEFKKKFQFGPGISLGQIGNFQNIVYTKNIGLFIRKEL